MLAFRATWFRAFRVPLRFQKAADLSIMSGGLVDANYS